MEVTFSQTGPATRDVASWSLSNVQIIADGLSDVAGKTPLETLTLRFGAITETITPSAGAKGITASWDPTTASGSGPTTFGGQTLPAQQPVQLDFGSGQVAVGSFSTGMDRSANVDNAGSGLSANGPLTFQDLVFTMPVGAASPAVLAALTQGTVLAKPVVLTVATTLHEPAETLTFNNVRVVGDQVSFPTADSNSEETVELQFGSLKDAFGEVFTAAVTPGVK
jgi:type VI protein secretion system component Hcp